MNVCACKTKSSKESMRQNAQQHNTEIDPLELQMLLPLLCLVLITRLSDFRIPDEIQVLEKCAIFRSLRFLVICSLSCLEFDQFRVFFRFSRRSTSPHPCSAT